MAGACAAAEHRLSFAHQLAHGLFGDRRANGMAHSAPRCSSSRARSAAGQLAVDVRRDERIDRGTARHGRDSNAEAYRTTSGVHAKYGTSRYRQECSACRQFLRTKTLPRLVTRPLDETPRATRRWRPAVRGSSVSLKQQRLGRGHRCGQPVATARRRPGRRRRCRRSRLRGRGPGRDFSPCYGES